MDQELLDLLARLNDENNPSPLTDEELGRLRTEIAAIATDIDPANATDEDLAVLSEAVSNVQVIDAEIATRAESAAERTAEAARLRDQIVTPVAQGEGGDGEEGEDGESEDGEPTEQPAGNPAGEPATETDATPATEPVAAAAAPQTRLPSIGALARRRPARVAPVERPVEQRRGAVLTAAADIPGLAMGQPVSLAAMGKAIGRKADALRNARLAEGSEKVYLGKISVEYPEDRTLRMDNGDEAKLEAAEALVAAGGICGPVDVDYRVESVGSRVRPVRDTAMDRFMAARGGLRFNLPASLNSIATMAPNAVGVWTQTNDITPASPTTKPVAIFDCPTVIEEYVDAVTARAQFGNFQQRYAPELIGQFLDTIMTWHARVAEATLLAAISTNTHTANTTVNGEVLGALSDFLATLDRAAAAIRYRNRIDPATPLRLIYPDFLLRALSGDIAREMPGSSLAERIAFTRADLDRALAARNINGTATLDSFTGAADLQGFDTQADAVLNGWPDSVYLWLYPEGTWTFLDGGEFDFGFVRDSTLNDTNDVQTFTETMEKAVFRGVESLEIRIDLCVSGARSALEDTSGYCVSGS